MTVINNLGVGVNFSTMDSLLDTTDDLLDELDDTINGAYTRSTITNTLSGCSNSNTATAITNGRSYSGTISVDAGKEISSASITMGGVDITTEVFNSSTGAISISSVNDDIVIEITAVETVIPYLTFSSPSSFTLSVYNNTKNWDGTIEYSTDKTSWNTWAGTSSLTSGLLDGEYVIYLRGIGNTYLNLHGTDDRWQFTGTNISCTGNIENLLDYATVIQGNHPPMATYCYKTLFYNCTNLIKAPDLLATTLIEGCYQYMFSGCTGLTETPSLPATTLAYSCYQSMFEGCTNLTSVPVLPATTLANYCYYSMFSGCSKIKLSATKTGDYQNEYRIPTSGTGTTANQALNSMFTGTGGTFTGTPTINTTYYTSNTIVGGNS